MATFTAAQLASLRTQPHRAKFYLSVSQPRTLLTATVTGTYSRGDTRIDYTGGTGSGYADIKIGQKLTVTTDDGTELVRVKGISGDNASGELTLAHNSIVWAAGQGLVVTEEYPLFLLVSRFYATGAYYKDQDIDYTDQNSAVNPVCIMGGHIVGFAPLTAAIDLTGSYSIASGSTIASYDCWLEPASAGTVTNTGTGLYTVTITTPGQCWLVGRAVDTNGKVQDTRRRVFAHDTGDNAPVSDVQIGSLNGDWQRGGYALSVEARGTAASGIANGALVVLWMDDGGDPVTLFSGYVGRGSIQYNWATGTVKFEAHTIDYDLGQIIAYNISLEAKRAPAEWDQYAIWLTTAAAIHHLFKWHSTLLDITDVVGLSDNRRRKYADTSQGTLWQQAQTMADKSQYRLCCDRAGRVHYQPDPLLANDTDRAALDVNFEMTAADVLGDIGISAQTPQAALVHTSGMRFDGEMNHGYCSKAPGDIILTAPKFIDRNNQVLTSQTHCNELAGRILAQENNPYPDVDATLNGGYLAALELTPPAWVTFSMAATDNPRGVVWSSKRLMPRSLNLQLNPAAGIITVGAKFETEATGPDGIFEQCASISAQGAGGTSTVIFPPVGSNLKALGVYGNSGHYWRMDGAGDWTERNGGVTTGDAHAVTDWYWFTPAKGNGYNPDTAAVMLRVQAGAIYRTTDAGATWTDTTPINDPPNSWSDGSPLAAGDCTFRAIGNTLFGDGTFYTLAEGQVGTAWRGWLSITTDNGVSWSWYPLFSGAAPTGLRPLWLMADRHNGSVLWVTVWRSGTLYLQKWALPALTFTETSLGAATQGEMEAETYTAAPCSKPGDYLTCYAYGRMVNPAGLTGTYAVIKTANGASSFSSIESGWGGDRCGAFAIDNSGNIYAVRAA